MLAATDPRTPAHVHDRSWCFDCPGMLLLVDRFDPTTGLNERVWVHAGTRDVSCSTQPLAVTVARP